MTTIETDYANTDFDLKSASSFDTLHRELSSLCCALYYTRSEEGHYHASYESDHNGNSTQTGAERDILLFTAAINSLSTDAKMELDACYLREFNIGFHCGDSWAFVHAIPHRAVNAASNAGCSLAVTLYPMRRPDGTPRE